MGRSGYGCCGLLPGHVELGHVQPSIDWIRLVGALGYVEQSVCQSVCVVQPVNALLLIERGCIARCASRLDEKSLVVDLDFVGNLS